LTGGSGEDKFIFQTISAAPSLSLNVSRIKEATYIESNSLDYQPNIIITDYEIFRDTLVFDVNSWTIEFSVGQDSWGDKTKNWNNLNYWKREGDDGSSHLFVDNNGDNYVDYHVKFLGLTGPDPKIIVSPAYLSEVDTFWFLQG
ncbi:MAG: hypothetical protein EBU14_07010, partial [Acetobacteraceae bacterium]|nr:hypothetical protein [Acetobacteraceae bacterium]